MTTVTVRKSGGANIVSLPKQTLINLNIGTGVDLDVQEKGRSIVLTPKEKTLTLQDLIDGTPKEKLVMTEEDAQWMEASSIGKENF